MNHQRALIYRIVMLFGMVFVILADERQTKNNFPPNGHLNLQ